MFRPSRTIVTLATMLLASVTAVATADAATNGTSEKPAATKKHAKAKPTEAKAKKHVGKKRLAALLEGKKKGEKRATLPDLPDPGASKKASVEKKSESEKLDKKRAKAEAKKLEKKSEKKAAPAPEEPPPELTGSLPQAKLADRKAKKLEKSEKAEKAEKTEKTEKTEKAERAKKAKGLKGPLEAKKGEVGFGRTPKERGSSVASKLRMKTCVNPSVSFARLGQPADVAFPLTTCNGKPTKIAIESLSVLARPYDVPAPRLMPVANLSRGPKGQRAFSLATGEIAPGVRRVDPGLVLRVQAIADRFPGKTITIVSGYRPMSKGSRHAEAKAFDLRVDGVTNETLVAFCKTLHDTGCGYYPNSFFVHVDVRAPGSGHTYWIDISGPGEKPVYVKSWPPPLPALPEKNGVKSANDANDATLPEAKQEKEIATTTDEGTIEAPSEPPSERR